MAYQSDQGFIEDEALTVDPAIQGSIYASVAKVHPHSATRPPRTPHRTAQVVFQPIDELSDFQTSSITLVNVRSSSSPTVYQQPS